MLLIFYILFIFYQYNQYCEQEQAINQGLHTELVYSTYKYIPHINIVDNDDLYCCAIECIDQGLHTELVHNTV